MDWDDLQTFLAIAREGSLSGAARALKTTQPTMGRRLAQMEKRIGARLLERHPRGYVLTSLGETILGNVERIEAEVMATERTITGKDIALEGTVRVTSVDVIASRIIVPAISLMQCTHPKIIVELIPDARSLNLSKREADIAIRMVRFENTDLVTKKLGTMKTGFFASKSYLKNFGVPNKFNSDKHLIINVLEDQMHLEEPKALTASFPNAHTNIKTNSREAMVQACKMGMGIACLPKRRATEESELVEIEADIKAPERDIWLGVHSDLRHMPRIRAVIDAISKEFDKHK